MFLVMIAALLAPGSGLWPGSAQGAEPPLGGVEGTQPPPARAPAPQLPPAIVSATPPVPTPAPETEPRPATAAARYGFLAHAGIGVYSLSVSDTSGAASSKASLLGLGAVATRNLSPAFGLGALAELTEFLGDSSGSAATFGLLIGPAAVFRAGALALTGGAALSVVGRGNGPGLGLIGAADVVFAGPVSLHGQLSYRDAFPSGGRVSFVAGEVGLGVVF